MSTTSVKTASNGNAMTGSRPERVTGMARVREAQAYHVASVAHDAAFEAERLCNDIYRAVSDAYLRDTSTSEAAQTAADPVIQDKIGEARRCLEAAMDELRALRGEPPF